MDIGAVGGAIGAVKTLVGMTKATADAIIDEKQREKLYEIRSGLMDLQEKVLEDQQSRMELLTQLETITKERDSLKDKKSKLDDYELFSVGPGRHVFRAKPQIGTPDHFACPNCITSTGHPSVLQVERGYGSEGNETRYWCTLCTFQIYV
jgi:hypothetical protein